MKFESVIYQKNGVIDATQLYKDIEDTIENEKNILNVEKLDRGHPLQHILNSTSGNYISPTAMKAFQQCPANYLYSKLVIEKTGSATSVGRSFHTIMERFYEDEDRSKENIYKIMNIIIEEDGQFDKKEDIKIYVNGYLESMDYLDDKPMNHSKLVCANEVFIKTKINPLGVDLDVPLYLKIDRIDIREDGIYVLDYKTGIGDPNTYLLGEYGYLPQMIFYKWGVEAEYGQEIKDAFLSLPGASAEYKYTKMNVNSLVEQSKVIEKVFYHLKTAKEIRSSMQFPERIMTYCSSCQMKYNCEVFVNAKNLDKSNILYEIPIELNYEYNSDL